MAIASVIVSVLCYGCEKQSTAPIHVSVESYDILLVAKYIPSNDNFLYRYNTRTNKKDSLLLPVTHIRECLAAPGAGNVVYLIAASGVITVDVRHMVVTNSLPIFPSEIAVSQSGQYLAAIFHDSLVFYDAHSKKVLHSVIGHALSGTFSSDSRSFSS